MIIRFLNRVFSPHAEPASPTPWRDDPEVAPWLHAKFRDDAQVVFWEGRWVEQMWVRLVAAHGEGVYTGQLLNQPEHITAAARGDLVRIRATAVELYHLTPEVEADIARYAFACQGCSFDMLLDPVAEVLAEQFPDLPIGASVAQFTTRCPQCDQAMVASLRG